MALALEDLGLGACEESVYRVLIDRPSASLAEVAEAAAFPDAQVADALNSLAARALVNRRPGSGHYVAAPPSVALGTELTERRIRLHRAELALAELVETYRTGSMGRAQRDLVEVVEGRDAVRQRYLQLQLSSRHAIDTFVTGDVQVVGPENTEEPTVLSRGLQVRAVIDQSFLGEPSAADNVDESLARGMRIRTVDGVPLKLIVCDGEMAMLPLRGSGSEVDPSLVLRGGLANVAQALFDAVWERARPYGEPHHGIDALDTRILRLLLAGLTDHAVAAQVDLSARTVQRRIQGLMSQAGATTRIQLGWYARHHGWA
ncbi:helix-turn-helix domain-containing protein [Streptomyces sp. NPDC056231]|uniref:helix-turn-helix domain-containing protein n=1 Tax=Streptomyces sp. NPDC056231 TaxID=3345755 RepID=UPI003AAB81D2